MRGASRGVPRQIGKICLGLSRGEPLPYFERAALVVSVTATGLALVTLTASHWWWLLAIPLTIAAPLGAIWAMRSGQTTGPGVLVEAPPVALLTLGSAIFLRQVEGPWRWGALGLAVFLLIALLLGGYYRLDPRSHLFGAARFTSNLVVYFLALGYFAGIYGARARSLQSATAITLVAFLLALYSLGPQMTRRSWLAAAVSGLMMGEVTWGLNYWPLGGLVGGLFLLLVFYGLTGTLHSYLLGRLDRGILVEFVAVLMGGFALLAASSFWMG